MASNDAARDIDRAWELIHKIGFAMLVTQDGDKLRARPMSASIDRDNNAIYFLTDARRHKDDEIARHPQVNLSFAHPGDQKYVSVSGTAELRTDRDSIRKAWSEAARVWFPKGVDEPNIVAIRVKVAHAEYWDSRASLMVLAYGYARALLTGKKLDQKVYRWHSGYPGGFKEEKASLRVKTRPELMVRDAVLGMLPKNKLHARRAKKLRIYADDKHPHAAQQLEAFTWK